MKQSLFAFLTLLMIAFSAINPVYAKNSGAIWTTNADCGEDQQDVNHYSVGETVYMNGANFEPGQTYTWTVTGQPGGASADPNIVVATGTVTANADGAFCIPVYVIQPDDNGEYTVDVVGARKNDNYRVRGVKGTPTPSPTQIPGVTPTTQPTPEVTPTTPPEVTPEPTLEPTPGATVTPIAKPTDAPQVTGNPAPTLAVTKTPGPTATPTAGAAKNESNGGTGSSSQNTGSSSSSNVQGVTSFPETGSNGEYSYSTDPSALDTILEIPSIQVRKPLYLASLQENQYVVRATDISEAHYQNTRLIYGHNTQPVFQKLTEIQTGDEIYLHRIGASERFVVSSIAIVAETDLESIVQLGADTIVLSTCLPQNEEKRIVVYAERAAL